MDDKPRAKLFGFPRDLILGLVAVAVVIGLVGGIGLGQLIKGSQGTAVETITPGPTAPLYPPTSTPSATNTPTGPHTINSPTLGGTADVWTAAYGQPDTSGFYPTYGITTAEGYNVALTFGGTASGTDGLQRDDRVVLTSQGAVTAQQLTSILPRYLPPDTKHVRDFTDPQIGLIHVFLSADLAATFPADDFTDSNSGQTLPPGTFSAACNQPGSAPECDVVLGD